MQSSKPKLSILINDLDTGGAERVVSILLDMLYKDYNITLFMLHNIIFYDIPKEIKIVIIGNAKTNDSGLFKFLKLPLLGWKYKNLNKDSYISLSFLSRSNYINIFAKLFGMKGKVIIGEGVMPSLQYKETTIEGKINRFLMKKLYNIADLVIPNSKGNESDLNKNFSITNTKVIYNLFDIEKITNLSKESIDIEDGFIFVTIGRLDEGKNHKLIIEAIKDIDAKLYIIGDGKLKGQLIKQIEDLGLSNRVFLVGKQKNPYKYLSKADCFVFASNREGSPNVLVEALTCKLPIISTDCKSGPREILAPSSDIDFQLKDNIELAEYGILTPINSLKNMIKAMNLIKNNPKLKDKYSKKAIKRASQFDKNLIIKQYIDCFNQLAPLK